MTESQPEGSEMTMDAIEENLIKESAFKVDENDQYTQRTSAKSSTNFNKRKVRTSQSKLNKKAKKIFLVKRESGSFVTALKQCLKNK